jgi:hypothetical protein
VRSSDNVIEQTWLAYAYDAPRPEQQTRAAIARVEGHYSPLIAGELARDESLGPVTGMALWQWPDERLRWPLWTQAGSRVMAATAVPTGWRRLTGDIEGENAARALLDALGAAPERAFELNPPFALGLRESETEALIVVNDFLGAGRLYELRFDGGWVWSNRLGALPLFAGVRPEPDREGWAIFAAAGWFMGETTPIAGARKLPPSTVIRVLRAGDTAEVGHERGDAEELAVRPRRVKLAESADAAAADVREMAEDLGVAWTVPIAISLTGGRDSRVSAAGALAAGIEATYNTGDQVPGEVDVVRELVGAAPQEMDHTVHQPEPDEGAEDELWERIRGIHLVHDGMRNPQEVRRPTEMPQTHRPPPTLSGHGGELGHGFYYGRRDKLRRLRRGGDEAIAEQLERNARRKHSAAAGDAYDLYLAECERTLARGREYGLEGPVLLDWFYMAQRLPYRSGLGARSGRSSACVAPAFVRGAFDLSPKDRLKARLHRAVVERLVPEWSKVDFFSSDSAEMPEIKRARIWERPADAAVVEEIIAGDGGWAEIFDPERIREMWAEVKAGEGSADYEHVFYRVVWRAGFDRHLETLARAAAP